MVVIEVKKIALNLSLPAKKIESSKLIPSLRFELNFEINTNPSFTRIPMSAIIPKREIRAKVAANLEASIFGMLSQCDFSFITLSE